MDTPTDQAGPHRAERAGLADLLLQVGPDAPTLCEGWTAADLAAHLAVRERRPIAAAGIVVRPLHGLHDRAIEKTRAATPFATLVDRVREGPPLWWRPVDALVNTQEYFIHHEDLRRGAGDTTPRPAAAIAAVEDWLWNATGRGARFATRGLRGIGVDLVRDTGDVIHARRDDEDRLTITGRAGEIVLWLSGRRDAAHVTLTGSEAALAVAHTAKLGV